MVYVLSVIIISIALIIGFILGFKPNLVIKKKIKYFPMYVFFIWILINLFRKFIFDNYALVLMSTFFFGIVVGSLASLYKKRK